jgi:predicted metalloendopeptidase
LDGSNLRFRHDQLVWITQKPYFDWLLGRIQDVSLSDWLVWMRFSVIYNVHQWEPELPSNAYYRKPELHHVKRRHRTRSTRHRRGRSFVSDEAHCSLMTQHMVPGLVMDKYFKTYFLNKDTIRADVKSIIQDILGQMKLQFPQEALQRKLDQVIIRVAEPDDWIPEPFGQRLSLTDYTENLIHVRKYRVKRNLDLWNKGFNRNAMAFFVMPTTSVNAYFDPTSNTITILAGILQSPFYDASYDKTSKYAILGSIIGHELSHMMDNSGLYFDENGSFHPDGVIPMQGFYSGIGQCIIQEYGTVPSECLEPGADPKMYGNMTMGEDLADLNGFRMALKALNPTSMNDKQRFFMILAQAFCETMDQGHKCETMLSDVHAYPEFRIDKTFANMPEFHAAFACAPGTKMYRDKVCSF